MNLLWFILAWMQVMLTIALPPMRQTLIWPSPAPIAIVEGSIWLIAKQYTNPAMQERLNTSLDEEREVAIRVLSCPSVYTMSLVQEMLNKFLKCSLWRMVNLLPPLFPGLVRFQEMSSPLQPLDRMIPSLGQPTLTQQCPPSCLRLLFSCGMPHAVHCPPCWTTPSQSCPYCCWPLHVLLLPNHHLHAWAPRQAVHILIVPPHTID